MVLSTLVKSALKSALAKLTLLWGVIMHAWERMAAVFDDGADNLIVVLASRFAESELAREILATWMRLIWQALSTYWQGLILVLAVALALAGGGHLPLAWRAIAARRRSVFVSFQNIREEEARDLDAILGREHFRTLRVPYTPDSGHQQIVVGVNELLRKADAVVCLPGKNTSFVDAEVAAATVARKPVVFLVSEGGTLPNTADKRHPAFVQERAAIRGYAPVIDFLHHITQDFKSACALYRMSWTHPAIGITISRVASTLLFASVALFVASIVHGDILTSRLDVAPDIPGARSLRWNAILLMSIPLLFGSLVLLPLATWFGLVARSLWIQLKAARRAALRVGAGEFSRADWVGIVPGMKPGDPLYESLQVSAPKAHHEVAT
jgi:hypothetical protein